MGVARRCVITNLINYIALPHFFGGKANEKPARLVILVVKTAEVSNGACRYIFFFDLHIIAMTTGNIAFLRRWRYAHLPALSVPFQNTGADIAPKPPDGFLVGITQGIFSLGGHGTEGKGWFLTHPA